MRALGGNLIICSVMNTTTTFFSVKKIKLYKGANNKNDFLFLTFKLTQTVAYFKGRLAGLSVKTKLFWLSQYKK